MSIRLEPEEALGPTQMRDCLAVQNISQGTLLLEHQLAGSRWKPVQVDTNHAILHRPRILRQPEDDLALVGIGLTFAAQYSQEQRLAIEVCQRGRHVRGMDEEALVGLRNFLRLKFPQGRHGQSGRLIEPLQQCRPGWDCMRPSVPGHGVGQHIGQALAHAYRAVRCAGRKNSCTSRSTSSSPSRLNRSQSPSIIREPRDLSRATGSANFARISTLNLCWKYARLMRPKLKWSTSSRISRSSGVGVRAR